MGLLTSILYLSNIPSNQVTSNGVCNSSTIGGCKNYTLSSTGVCNEQLTGG